MRVASRATAATVCTTSMESGLEIGIIGVVRVTWTWAGWIEPERHADGTEEEPSEPPVSVAGD